VEPIPPNSGVLMEQAGQAAEGEEWSVALDLYDRVLSREPEHAQALSGKVNLLRSAGDLDRAALTLEFALRVHPENVELLVEQGELAYAKNDMAAAEEAFGKVLRRDSANSDAALGLADVFAATGREEQARSLLEGLQRRNPEDLDVALRLGWNRLRTDRLNGAMHQFVRAIANPDTAYSARLGIATVHLVRHNFGASKRELRTAIEQNPQAAEAYCNLAWVHVVERRELDQAEQCCEQALGLNSSYASAFDCLGVISFQRQNLRQAEAYFRRAIEINPADAGTLIRLGLLHVEMGDPFEARRRFDEAIEKQPWNDLALYGRGCIFYQSGELALALRDFRRASVINAQNGLALRGSALTLARMGSFSDACILLHAGLSTVPSRDAWQVRLALAQVLVQAGLEMKDQDVFLEALEEAERANQERKGSKEICFIAGIAAARVNDYRKAEGYFQEVVKLDSLDLRAKRSLRLVQTLTTRRKRGEIVTPTVKWVLFGLVFLQIIALWLDFPRKIGEIQFAALLPVFMGLMLVVFFLPRLIELKLPGGFEAKLEVATEINATEILPQLKPDEALTDLGMILGLPFDR
jgi:tetratricopeptide (TPR) repeat protein